MQTRISSQCRLESLGDGGDEGHVVGVEGHDGDGELRRNSTPASEEIRPRRPKKFDPGFRRNSTPASEEIRPRRPKKFDPGVSKNSTPASEKFDPGFRRFRPRRLEEFDLGV
jgi:hypothetical protein